MDRATIIAIIALLGVVVLASRMRREASAEAAGADARQPAAPAAPGVEVAHHMNRIQAYAEKLWWAGDAGNLPLARFYRHEIKEEMEAVATAGIVDEGAAVSELMQVYGIRSIDAMKELLATGGLKDFRSGYESLILACNSCHAASGHPEIVVAAPTANRFTGQVFAPRP